jgi:hypothetical protein
VNDQPVIVPAATPMSATLIEAIRVVRAAGYRVSKPRKPKIFNRGKDRAGPTIVCEFFGGVVTRMTVHTPVEPGKLDWSRGMKLARAAYQSRWRAGIRAHHLRATGKPCAVDLVAATPPAIVKAHFEQDGKVIARYQRENVA